MILNQLLIIIIGSTLSGILIYILTKLNKKKDKENSN